MSVLGQQRTVILNQLIQYPAFAQAPNLTVWTTPPVFNDDGSLHTPGVPAVDADGNPQSGILIMEKGNIASAILGALARTGLSIALFYSSFDEDHAGETKVFFNPVHFEIDVIESVTQNRDAANGGTSLEDLDCVEAVCAALKNWQPAVEGADTSYCIQIRPPGCVNITSEEEMKEGFSHWCCHFSTKASLTKRPTP